ncbi:hypothetical protein K491DRAFT_716082 [Lophiostoma macrostomum CBS 122681]|uniref:Uncharacterized protein n=1 Tax=Lophiostoma macrostomum CBS 122681 TaxID=1314788 RepID=A0A6A6T8U1_9PLEO|nr:hypothetical protein K491DRAFT_716082 [Lophiostoma macrostomum CBS 122681]
MSHQSSSKRLSIILESWEEDLIPALPLVSKIEPRRPSTDSTFSTASTSSTCSTTSTVSNSSASSSPHKSRNDLNPTIHLRPAHILDVPLPLPLPLRMKRTAPDAFGPAKSPRKTPTIKHKRTFAQDFGIGFDVEMDGRVDTGREREKEKKGQAHHMKKAAARGKKNGFARVDSMEGLGVSVVEAEDEDEEYMYL